ncbi:MAG: hypothetical protein P8I62_05960 [Pseudomonadales bacterium]|nr:hypothetical protein [Pseudomonadales bacterium]
MKKILSVLALSLLTNYSLSVYASELSYSYVSAAYQSIELFGEDGDGVGLVGSFEIGDQAFITASYSSLASDDTYNNGSIIDDLEIDAFTLGFGFHTPISDTTDLVTTISYLDQELDYGGSVDGDGFGINVGIRSKVSETVELGGSFTYVDFEGETDNSFSLGARYLATETISFGLGHTSADDADSITIDLRLNLN